MTCRALKMLASAILAYREYRKTVVIHLCTVLATRTRPPYTIYH